MKAGMNEMQYYSAVRYDDSIANDKATSKLSLVTLTSDAISLIELTSSLNWHVVMAQEIQNDFLKMRELRGTGAYEKITTCVHVLIIGVRYT